eukprot:CAMPEP_0181177484 /NCGR_PEP_ID=MMETSP1096-20121128/5185_1 /TAXON_ID=156174 ORGANISM="Chrysochromulina ericina, Strain CCMP281" /NCGR_SAMPLE_ID=MMETSP1096 /ASSEMBLY_ACC=CAM_ASM_000453 /LENGTH=436 /DNA_ID=CAMNT_0023265637 /DNA_START=106 /DNA_END=1416 /DNA_ORIENTATION=+
MPYIRGGAFYISQPNNPQTALFPRKDMGISPAYKNIKRIRGGHARNGVNRTPSATPGNSARGKGDMQQYFRMGEPGTPPFALPQVILKPVGAKASSVGAQEIANEKKKAELTASGMSADEAAAEVEGSPGSPDAPVKASSPLFKTPNASDVQAKAGELAAKAGEAAAKAGQRAGELAKKAGQRAGEFAKSAGEMKVEADAFMQDAAVGLQKLFRGKQGRRKSMAVKSGVKPTMIAETKKEFRASGFTRDIMFDVVGDKPKAADPIAEFTKAATEAFAKCTAYVKTLVPPPAPEKPVAEPVPDGPEGEFTSILMDGTEEALAAEEPAEEKPAATTKANFRASGFTRGVIGAGVAAVAPPPEEPAAAPAPEEPAAATAPEEPAAAPSPEEPAAAPPPEEPAAAPAPEEPAAAPPPEEPAAAPPPEEPAAAPAPAELEA